MCLPQVGTVRVHAGRLCAPRRGCRRLGQRIAGAGASPAGVRQSQRRRPRSGALESDGRVQAEQVQWSTVKTRELELIYRRFRRLYVLLQHATHLAPSSETLGLFLLACGEGGGRAWNSLADIAGSLCQQGRHPRVPRADRKHRNARENPPFPQSFVYPCLAYIHCVACIPPSQPIPPLTLLLLCLGWTLRSLGAQGCGRQDDPSRRRHRRRRRRRCRCRRRAARDSPRARPSCGHPFPNQDFQCRPQVPPVLSRPAAAAAAARGGERRGGVADRQQYDSGEGVWALTIRSRSLHRGLGSFSTLCYKRGYYIHSRSCVTPRWWSWSALSSRSQSNVRGELAEGIPVARAWLRPLFFPESKKNETSIFLLCYNLVYDSMKLKKRWPTVTLIPPNAST